MRVVAEKVKVSGLCGGRRAVPTAKVLMVDDIEKVSVLAQHVRHPGRAAGLALRVSVLDHQKTAGTQERGGSDRDAADDIEPVVTAVERTRGVVLAHLRVARHRVVRDVRRVAHHDVDPTDEAHQRIELRRRGVATVQHDL